MNFFNNHYLFSESYIKEYVSTQKKNAEHNINSLYTIVKEWHDDEGSTRNWFKNYILPVIDAVNFRYKGTTNNMVALYTDSPATDDKPVAVLYAIDKGLDLNSKCKGKYYAYKAVRAAKEHGADWAMLTDGYRWQIYHVKNVSPFENYLEVNIENSIRNSKTPDEAFLLFQLFFSAQTYYREDSGELIIEKIKEKSDAKAEQVENFLRSKAEEILKDICYGFKDNMNQESYNSVTCRMIYEDAITLLFRILFFGYAESRELLPRDVEDRDYDKESFFKLCAKAKDILNSGNANEYKDGFEFWDELDAHLRIYVNETYNGGLFNNDTKPILRNYRMANGWLMKCLAEISYQKDKKSNTYNEKIEYKDLSVRNLGSIYEGLLEFNLFIADEQMIKRTAKGKTQYLKTSGLTLKKSDEPNIIEIGDIYLSQDATERKDSGAYYTPEDVVEYIVGNTVGKKMAELKDVLKQQLQSDYTELGIEPTQLGRKIIQQRIDDKTIKFINEKILSLSIIDSAMGSGHFLVNAAYRLANDIVEVLCENDWESDEDIHVDINYWKRMVVEKCIYGIDINGLAVMLAKLSLWLISADNRYALSFIDHHLKEGNSIIGTNRHHVKTSEQVGPLFETSYQEVMGAIFNKYNELHQIGSATKEDVEKQKEVYRETQSMLKLIKKKYDYYLASQYMGGIGDEYHFFSLLRSQDRIDFELPNMQPLWAVANEKKFFHWELEFPEVLIRGGFDIAIGNPPYVEYHLEEFKPLSLVNKAVGNLFAPMLENTIKAVSTHGIYGFIVPISIVSTERMGTLQQFIDESSKEVCYINFAVRPAKIFKKVDMNITIFYGTKCAEAECKIYTTNYFRWFTKERSTIFDNIKMVESSMFKDLYNIPKIGCEIESNILKKIMGFKTKVIDYIDKNGEAIYLHSGGRYWRKCLNEKVSSQYMPYFFSKKHKGLFTCLFNSNLFYWYWIAFSDCYHVTRRDVLGLNISLDIIDERNLKEFDLLAEQLMESYEKHAEITARTKNGSDFFEKKYYPKYSKDIINTIDRRLAEIYYLTDEEINFLINYDIRFRLGDDEGE